MEDLNDIHPGKLKRKSKRNASASVVDLPPASPSTGNLLGDALMQSDASVPAMFGLAGESSDAHVSSKVDDVTDSSISPDIVALKPDVSDAPVSPIDLLKSPDDDRSADKQPKQRVEKRAEIVDPDNYSKPADSEKLSDLSAFAMPDSIRTLRRKSAVQADASVEKAEPTPDDLLAQARAINAKCLETLTVMQNTNAQNERRYALYLSIGFIILAILTVIGVVIGMGMRNTAKYNELRFKHEVYKNAVESSEVLAAEFEKEKRGSAAALEVYQLIEKGDFDDAVKRFNEVRGELTHPAETELLKQKIDEIQWRLAENAYHEGVMRFNTSNYELARDAFFQSLSHQENTPYTPRLNYYLAMSLYQLGDFEGARRYFSQITPSDMSPEMDANTRFYRAVSAEKLGDETEAAEQYDMFLKKFRNHRLADLAAKNRAKLDTSRK